MDHLNLEEQGRGVRNKRCRHILYIRFFLDYITFCQKIEGCGVGGGGGLGGGVGGGGSYT